MAKKIPKIYLLLQKRLKDKSDVDNRIKISKAKICIGHTKHPKKIRPVILKELEEFGLVRRINKFKMEVINCGAYKKLEKTGDIYKELGLF